MEWEGDTEGGKRIVVRVQVKRRRKKKEKMTGEGVGGR